MILVTNDDGIDSEACWRSSSPCAGSTRLSSSLQIATGQRRPHQDAGSPCHEVAPVRLADGSEAFSSDGTPSDCVALAMLGIAGEKPRLVVSGVNKAQPGRDITYSRTVAAAMEGVVWGIPSIAVSLADFYQWDFAYAAEVRRPPGRTGRGQRSRWADPAERDVPSVGARRDQGRRGVPARQADLSGRVDQAEGPAWTGLSGSAARCPAVSRRSAATSGP